MIANLPSLISFRSAATSLEDRSHSTPSTVEEKTDEKNDVGDSSFNKVSWAVCGGFRAYMYFLSDRSTVYIHDEPSSVTLSRY